MITSQTNEPSKITWNKIENLRNEDVKLDHIDLASDPAAAVFSGLCGYKYHDANKQRLSPRHIPLIVS